MLLVVSLARRGAVGEDQVDLELHELRSERGQAPVVALRPPCLDDEVLAFDIAALLHAFAKGVEEWTVGLWRGRPEETDAVDFGRRLGVRRQGRGQQHARGGEKHCGGEAPALDRPHGRILSAREMSDGAMRRASACEFFVLRCLPPAVRLTARMLA